MKLTNSNGVLTKEVTGWKEKRCPEKCPRKKSPPPQEIASRRITIRKYGTQESFPLEIYPALTSAKIPLMKIAPRKNTPQKFVFLGFFPLLQLTFLNFLL